MGRQGYKGIASISENVYVINDDGDHVIKLLEITGPKECVVQVIAGKAGVEGDADAEVGTDARLSRPGRYGTCMIPYYSMLSFSTHTV